MYRRLHVHCSLFPGAVLNAEGHSLHFLSAQSLIIAKEDGGTSPLFRPSSLKILVLSKGAFHELNVLDQFPIS